MEWWQTLMVAAVPAAVTAISVLWANAGERRRDVERHRVEVAERSEERRHSRELAELAHRHDLDSAELQHGRQLRDRWRDERKAAHAAVLAALDALLAHVDRERSELWSRAPWEGGPSSELTGPVVEARAVVDLVGSEKACAALDEAVLQASAHVFNVWVALVDRSPRTGESEEDATARTSETATSLDEDRRQLLLAVELYRQAAREELETER